MKKSKFHITYKGSFVWRFYGRSVCLTDNIALARIYTEAAAKKQIESKKMQGAELVPVA